MAAFRAQCSDPWVAPSTSGRGRGVRGACRLRGPLTRSFLAASPRGRGLSSPHEDSYSFPGSRCLDGLVNVAESEAFGNERREVERAKEIDGASKLGGANERATNGQLAREQLIRL